MHIIKISALLNSDDFSDHGRKLILPLTNRKFASWKMLFSLFFPKPMCLNVPTLLFIFVRTYEHIYLNYIGK